MIRLLTVIGHGTNLLPHFIKHYQDQVDEINIAVYETEMYPFLEKEIKQIVENQHNIKIVKVIKDRVFDWEKVTQLYNFVKDQNPNDWWVIADIDEFHLYSDSLSQIIHTCNKNGYELVRGGFIDRIGHGGELAQLKNGISIWEQFPNAGFFRYPMSNANPNKVCIMKGSVELTSGQHYAKIDGQTTWKWQGWNHPLINPHDSVQVHHFKWDSTSEERIKAVADIKKPYAHSDEYRVMYNQLRKTKFKIDLNNPEYMIELDLKYPKFEQYTKWNKLYNKIISI